MFPVYDPKTGKSKKTKTVVEEQTIIKSKQGEEYFNKLVDLRKKLVEDLKKEIGKDAEAQKQADKIVAEMSYLSKLNIDIQKGGTSLGEMIASVPSTIYDIASTIMQVISL